MLRVAITGGIASGKSLVGSILREQGYAVCETDKLSHELIKSGTPSFVEIVKVFGSDILDLTGEIHRGRLGSLVFENSECRNKLNAIVHPRVRERWKCWLREQPERTRIGIVIIPLLFEVDAHEGWDAIICISAPEKSQLSHLRDRGYTYNQALIRIRSQLPAYEKEKLSDFIIHNEGTKRELSMQVVEVISKITRDRDGSTKQ